MTSRAAFSLPEPQAQIKQHKTTAYASRTNINAEWITGRFESNEITDASALDHGLIWKAHRTFQQLVYVRARDSAKLPPDIFFKPAIHLLAWRPRGLLNETAVNKVIAFIRDV